MKDHHIMIRKLLTTLILALVSASFAQSDPHKITEELIKHDLDRVVCKNKERAEGVKQLFISKGAKADDITVAESKKVQNIIVTKKGRTSETIVIGAHYDKVAEGCGAIDNWTGIVLLANIYAAFSTAETEKTLVFAAFGREEEGLIGSREMAKSIAKADRLQYCSMVNLDSFGLHYPQVLTNASNAKMSKFAKELANEVKMPFSEASLAGSADADSTSFLDVGIPAITFHGLSNKWAEILHSPNDKLEKVNTRAVYVAFQFAALYLNRLDPRACEVFRR
jgi:Zn-dependent M28 family amino/carboxypeptidase